jgi:hypothetical protein
LIGFCPFPMGNNMFNYIGINHTELTILEIYTKV